MHFRRTNTVVFTMLEHDRCAFSIVVQTTAMSSCYGHDARLRFREPMLVPDAWCPAALCVATFRRGCAIAAQMSRKRRKRRFCSRPRSCCRNAAAANLSLDCKVSQCPCRRALEEATPASDPHHDRRVHEQRSPTKYDFRATSWPGQDAALRVAIDCLRWPKASMLSDRNYAFIAAMID